jgi:hypothetical protein
LPEEIPSQAPSGLEREQLRVSTASTMAIFHFPGKEKLFHVIKHLITEVTPAPRKDPDEGQAASPVIRLPPILIRGNGALDSCPSVRSSTALTPALSLSTKPHCDIHASGGKSP